MACVSKSFDLQTYPGHVKTMITAFCEGFIEGFKSGPRLFFGPVTFVYRTIRKLTRLNYDTNASAPSKDKLSSGLSDSSEAPPGTSINERVDVVEDFSSERDKWHAIRLHFEEIKADASVSDYRKRVMLNDIILKQVSPLLRTSTFQDSRFRKLIRRDVIAIGTIFREFHGAETELNEKEVTGVEASLYEAIQQVK